MKNNTKIRLRLSKQLFESLANQVLAEGKGDMSGGAYTEAVKAPKGEKKHKEEKADDKEHSAKKTKSEALNVSKNTTPSMVYSVSDLKKKLTDLARQVSLMKGLDSAEIGAIVALLDDVIGKVQKGSIVNPLKTATKAFSASTRNLEKGVKEMETKVAEEESEEAVKITLDEYMESGDWSYQLGKWAVENMPKIADAIKGMSTSGDPGQQLVDLGNAIAGLAVGGAATLGAGLAIAKDDIKKVAQKVKGMLGGKKDAVTEGKDEDLAVIVAKIPSDFKQGK